MTVKSLEIPLFRKKGLGEICKSPSIPLFQRGKHLIKRDEPNLAQVQWVATFQLTEAL